MLLPSAAKAVSLATCLTWLVLSTAWADDTTAAKAPVPVKEQVKTGPVREMAIVAPGQQDLECHSHRPTGSHIAAMRCESKTGADSPRARAAQELARKDLDEIRRIQMAQDLLRQQALADAARRIGR